MQWKKYVHMSCLAALLVVAGMTPVQASESAAGNCAWLTWIVSHWTPWQQVALFEL